VAHEVSRSLSLRYASEAVTSAAAELLGAPTALWARSEDGPLRVACRSDDPHGRVPPADLEVPALVTTSADDARHATDTDSSAYPLVLAGIVVGVLHVSVPAADDDTEQVLAALLSTAVAALESARLNGAARERADVDAITQLPNRRRMDADLQAEWERCRRYDRPVSFVMIDLDHFKQLNDVYGHPLGDTALRATAVASAAVTVPGSDVKVTVSIGVAERSAAMTDPLDLVAAADVALYAARRSGRNRVVASSPVTDAMPDGSEPPRYG